MVLEERKNKINYNFDKKMRIVKSNGESVLVCHINLVFLFVYRNFHNSHII